MRCGAASSQIFSKPRRSTGAVKRATYSEAAHPISQTEGGEALPSSPPKASIAGYKGEQIRRRI